MTDTDFVERKDLRLLSREELLKLKTAWEVKHGRCKQQYQDACTRLSTAGEASDPEWISRLRNAMRYHAACVHKINLRLSTLRAENHARTAQQTVNKDDLFRAFFLASRARARKDPTFSEVFGALCAEAHARIATAKAEVISVEPTDVPM